jgi:demethylmenaquinone methyltransferase/2-methoxy-6-polyprenyl-1,4-benzoquinol methylase
LDHFSLLAPLYEKVIKPKEPEQILRLAALPAAGPLLDAGGGTGRVAQYMLDQAGQVVVADLSVAMLQQASQKDGLQAVCAHTEKLPFPDGYFERIIMIDALHHVCNQADTARDLWRVLKLGGRLVIEEPDVRTGVVKLVALFEKLALMRSHFLSPPAIVALFDGFAARTHTAQDGHIAWVVVDKPRQNFA